MIFTHPYILKAGFHVFWNPQIILNSLENAERRLRTQKLSILQCVRNKGQEVLKDLQKSRKSPIYMFFLLIMYSSDISFVYQLLSQHFVVTIYALFPQIIWDSGSFFAFRMYTMYTIHAHTTTPGSHQAGLSRAENKVINTLIRSYGDANNWVWWWKNKKIGKCVVLPGK